MTWGRSYEGGGRDRRTQPQATPGASRRGDLSGGKGSPVEPLEECGCENTWVLDSCPPGLGESKFLLFEAATPVVMRHGGPGK